jgi:PhnB protein
MTQFAETNSNGLPEEHMMELSPYLLFNGDCEPAFKYYEKHLGGKIEAMMPHEGSPAAEHVPAEWRNKILHARMTVGDQVLMASDVPPGDYHQPQGFSVSLGIKDVADAERIFHALAEGGKVTMPLEQTFWALRFGMVTDRFGIPWMINCEGAA